MVLFIPNQVHLRNNSNFLISSIHTKYRCMIKERVEGFVYKLDLEDLADHIMQEKILIVCVEIHAVCKFCIWCSKSKHVTNSICK